YGRNPVALHALRLLDSPEQLQKVRIGFLPAGLTFAKVPQVDAGEDDFPGSCSFQGLNIFQHVRNGVASAMPSGEGDRTKTAIVIAAVLNFEKHPGAVIRGIGCRKPVYLFDVAGADPGAVSFRQAADMLSQVKLFGG